MYLPQLDGCGKRVLRVIHSHGVVPGWQVMSEAGISAEDLVKYAGQLMDYGLIKASGSISPPEVEKAFFNIQPSNSQLAEIVLNAP